MQPSGTVVTCRVNTLSVVLQVDREKKRAAAAAAREKREQAAKSWFGWLKGVASQTGVRSLISLISSSSCLANKICNRSVHSIDDS